MINEPLQLPSHFRKMTAENRQNAFYGPLGLPEGPLGIQGLEPSLADAMVENSIGYFALPLGVVPEFPVNGKTWNLPLATEEPSVIAAAAYAGKILSKSGGLAAEAEPALMKAEIFIENSQLTPTEFLKEFRTPLENALEPHLVSMNARGGGLRDITVRRLPLTGVLLIQILVNVCDAMGANLLNSLAEKTAPLIEEWTGGRKLMAILSNNADHRLARARFSIPVDQLAKAGIPGEEMGRRLEMAWKVAGEDPDRAITHNKGIMNGITAFALATGNDTRALEASVHIYAQRTGTCKPLSTFHVENAVLIGELELPLSLAVVGGAMGIHPQAQAHLKALGNPNAQELSALAAALGLAQNFAALYALVGEGIQKGHMALHARRLAFQAGARGAQVDTTAARITEKGIFNHQGAEEALKDLSGS